MIKNVLLLLVSVAIWIMSNGLIPQVYGAHSQFSDEQEVPLTLRSDSAHQITVEVLPDREYELQTSGTDPYIFTTPLLSRLPKNTTILAFEYFCPKGLDHLEVRFYSGTGAVLPTTKMVRRIGSAEGWVSFAVALGEVMGAWGQTGDYLRLDWGNLPDVNLQIRNLHLRSQTEREREIADTRNQKKVQESFLETHLSSYLEEDFPGQISSVNVTASKVIVKGNIAAINGVYLCEIAPYQDVTETQNFDTLIPLPDSAFTLSIDRYVARNGVRYDRLLSKWALTKKSDNGYQLLSHARYASKIRPKYNLPDEKAKSRKGLGGFSTGRGHIEDLDSLDITSATVNIWFTRFMYTKAAPDRIAHTYQNQTFHFDRESVSRLDSTFRLTAKRNIIVAAILLISKAEQCPDPEIGRLLQHPDCDPAGIYSMPNMTTPESVQAYAAALDFLASRYSRPDQEYGRIHHWIMHNEVDAGWVWTNAGEKTALVFMDLYLKSMRMCYNIARSYNTHSEVFITLTHYWAWTSHPNFYPSKDLLKILLDYTHAEGDFEWALAQHPYPESLREPKTWLDQKVTFDYETPLITFKNLEVLDAWIKRPEVLYQGKQKRTLWLSENGTNSPDYSEQSLREQAAGFAYAWKKMKHLDGIDGFQWHNWFDHRKEGGLRIGLRRFPDDEVNPGGRKPVWEVYQAADEPHEDAVFDPYKETIGISDWEELIHQGSIDPVNKQKTYRDLRSDNWVATDALGRKLPDYEACGPVKDNRFVGIFYFLTHTDSTGVGPFDVSKIIAANPKDPQWGKGAHFWGEPEIGYYLNYEKWAIQKHARELSDAGVDVLIFDVTNNKTFPEVYGPICETFREMRAKGEVTPDICFLGSEVSILQLWQDIYQKGRYADLWFHWKGKPLLLHGQFETNGRMRDVLLPQVIRDFFTLKESWAWTSLDWYDDGKDEWPWVDHYPQAIGWHDSPDEAEMVPVTVGQHPLSNIGRSFHQFHQPTTNEYDLTPYTDQGLCFAEQWSRALEVDPEFVFITGWNEWSAGRQVMKEDISTALEFWDFYPGAHLGKVGKKLHPGDVYFIDQYNQEYSRDIEPMAGGHTDNYYYQMMANIRRYKGLRPPEAVSPPTTIRPGSNFSQWDSVKPEYRDHRFDTQHRNSPGIGQSGPYLNASGRNDLVSMKVARDTGFIYFYAQTLDPISTYRDSNWMLLLIDSDQDSNTGWKGYDYLINRGVVDKRVSTLEKYDPDRGWVDAKTLRYSINGNELILAVPRAFIGETDSIALDFHWGDHISLDGDMREWFLYGDHAPERRANFRYEPND